MLGLFLLYFIGNAYYKLAEAYKKSKWGFAILGVVAYYAGTFLGGIVIALYYELVLMESAESVSDLLLTFLALPFGLLVCWGFYKFLQHQWKKPDSFSQPDVLDSELMQ